ncbi:hypothetical protein LPB140_05240 [Sphingorhabdus lutea]|uniref:Uncharacterized protein n=1 Tax=Sphingorhabdus lutea TaxID=1913578 RepID=A0A1L3JEP1_9SPHN|nr:hypothetical protein LPB140_05240 [Sphingorhabdus lutea]
MNLPIFVQSKDAIIAQSLIDEMGMLASVEANERAHKYRDLGNYILFARWRQIERLIIILSNKVTFGTIH